MPAEMQDSYQSSRCAVKLFTLSQEDMASSSGPSLTSGMLHYRVAQLHPKSFGGGWTFFKYDDSKPDKFSKFVDSNSYAVSSLINVCRCSDICRC